MRDSLPRLFYGVGLALMVGWILLIARPIILPVVASVVVAYVVLGLAELIGRIPGGRLPGARVPASLRYALAVALGLGVMAAIVWLIVQNINQVSTLLPRYQDQFLALVQRAA